MFDPQYQKSEQQLATIISRVPYIKRFEYRAFFDQDLHLQVTLPFDARNIGNAIIKAIHGGAVASFLENTAWLELTARLGNDRSIKPFTITNDYLRPTNDSDLHCKARVVKWGRRSVSVLATAWQADPKKPVSQATCHFLIVPQTESKLDDNRR
jgi:uncharacterized protein (TIGR00369 family)